MEGKLLFSTSFFADNPQAQDSFFTPASIFSQVFSVFKDFSDQ